jgi:hypothetical protein
MNDEEKEARDRHNQEYILHCKILEQKREHLRKHHDYTDYRAMAEGA